MITCILYGEERFYEQGEKDIINRLQADKSGFCCIIST